jgi:flagellar basal-body rod modification protein FlgD
MTESIPGVTNVAQPAQAGSAAQALGGLGPDAFLKLLVAQLKYQNPMEPTDGTQLLQQTAQFTQVETLQSVADAQRQLTGLTQFSLAVGLSGKQVTALGPAGTPVTGLVDSIRYNVDGPELSIGGEWISINNVLEVQSTG